MRVGNFGYLKGSVAVNFIFKLIKIVVSCSPKYILKSAHNEETANQLCHIQIAKGWTYNQGSCKIKSVSWAARAEERDFSSSDR